MRHGRITMVGAFGGAYDTQRTTSRDLAIGIVPMKKQNLLGLSCCEGHARGSELFNLSESRITVPRGIWIVNRNRPCEVDERL